MYFFEPGRVSSVNRSRVKPSVVRFWGLIELLPRENRDVRRDMVVVRMRVYFISDDPRKKVVNKALVGG